MLPWTHPSKLQQHRWREESTFLPPCVPCRLYKRAGMCTIYKSMVRLTDASSLSPESLVSKVERALLLPDQCLQSKAHLPLAAASVKANHNPRSLRHLASRSASSSLRQRPPRMVFRSVSKQRPALVVSRSVRASLRRLAALRLDSRRHHLRTAAGSRLERIKRRAFLRLMEQVVRHTRTARRNRVRVRWASVVAFSALARTGHSLGAISKEGSVVPVREAQTSLANRRTARRRWRRVSRTRIEDIFWSVRLP